MRPFTEDETGDIIINPYYAVILKDYLFANRDLAAAKEDWVLANTKLLTEDMKVSGWLEEFLDAITLERSAYDGHDIINPSLAVIISDKLRGDHDTAITREVWVKANTKLIKEYGAEKWLWRLLDALETGGTEVDNI